MTTRTFDHFHDGALKLSVDALTCQVEVIATPGRHHTTVEISTQSTDGRVVDFLERMYPSTDGDFLGVDLTNVPLTSFGGGERSRFGFGRRRGRGGQQVSNSIVGSTIHGGVIQAANIHGDVTIGRDNFGVVQAGGSVVVGRDNHGTISTGGSGGQGESDLRVVARVPLGSHAMVQVGVGKVTTRDVASVMATVSTGEIEATGLVNDSRLSVSAGQVLVGAAQGASPEVVVDVGTGQIVLLDRRVRLDASGHVVRGY